MDYPPPAAEEAAEYAPGPTPSIELPSANPRSSRGAVGRDLYRSANRRLVFGPINASAAALTGIGAMALWSEDTNFASAVVGVGAEAFSVTGLGLLAAGVQMQRRAQAAFGYEPGPNPFYGAGLALGGGALVLGAVAPGALATENKPFIYASTGGAAVLGIGGLATLIVANVVESRRTRPMVERSWGQSAVSLEMSGAGVTATW